LSTDSFTVSPLTAAVSNFGVAVTDPRKIAAASTAAGVPGDNAAASQISQLTNAVIGNLGNATLSDYYSSLVSTVGTLKRSTADGLTFDNSLLSQLQTQRDSVSGVSLDEEATRLIRFQRSYEAAARVINVADELFQTLLKL
jgi:flagellar hook-associated protein 1 FlgK